MRLKTFIKKLLIFIILLFVADRVTGYIMQYLYNNAGGVYARENYIRNEVMSDILVFGSSRATHHYVPSIISDSLGMSCYNCGSDGNGIVYVYGRLQNIYARYTPKMIILDLYAPLDIEKNDNTTYLKYLRPDYGKNNDITELFNKVDKTELLKMQLFTYRYNSTIEKIFSNIYLT